MGKIILGFLVVLVILFTSSVFKAGYSSSEITYGANFSPRYAKYLKLGWQKVYLQILDELQVKDLRIPSYWDIVEPQPNKYNFLETDFMINEAGKRGAKLILVLGTRQPRWPECHVPAWAEKLDISQRQQKTLEFIQKVIDRYKDKPEIWAWQVENEPFAFWFGQNCDVPDTKFLQTEISLVKKLDSRPVIVTDSGEWSSWIEAMKISDILGISLYRKAYNETLSTYITYPFLNWMYPLKSNLIKQFFAPNNSKTIISEFQAEPWVQQGIPDTPIKQQLNLFSIADFKDNIKYAQKTGFDKMYLWGVEWWFYMAEQGHPEYLEYAKTLFKY